jgi:hypothetical protein
MQRRIGPPCVTNSRLIVTPPIRRTASLTTRRNGATSIACRSRSESAGRSDFWTSSKAVVSGATWQTPANRAKEQLREAATWALVRQAPVADSVSTSVAARGSNSP